MTSEAARPESNIAVLPITGLLSYKVRRLANAISSSAAIRYRRDFDVSLPEWRTLALLGHTEPMTINRLARLAALDKGQMSRVISGLVERQLVRKELGVRRSTLLTLSDGGRRTYAGLIAAANEREEFLLSVLTVRERQVLDAALDKLFAKAIDVKRAEESTVI